MKERKYQRRDKKFCSKCGKKLEPSRVGKYRYCKKCHAEYMRKNRPHHKDMTEEQKKKANARGYLHVYIKRGKIVRLSCRDCGSEKSEAHHPDYSKPLEVIWLCRDCHLKLHNG